VVANGSPGIQSISVTGRQKAYPPTPQGIGRLADI
jgi:hypothetical protein